MSTKDRVDVGLDPELAEKAKQIQRLLHLTSVQDVARMAIAYAVRREVELKASERRSGDITNTLKASELDKGSSISETLRLYYPNSEDLRNRPNLCLEHLMNEGVRLMASAMEDGSITSLASLMPSGD